MFLRPPAARARPHATRTPHHAHLIRLPHARTHAHAACTRAHAHAACTRAHAQQFVQWPSAGRLSLSELGRLQTVAHKLTCSDLKVAVCQNPLLFCGVYCLTLHKNDSWVFLPESLQFTKPVT